MKLSSEAFERARDFLAHRARPLERALFEVEFEAGAAEAAALCLDEFRNADGGYGMGLEPDLGLPASSVLATTYALQILAELGVSSGDGRVAAAVDWLVGVYDDELGAWRQITEEAEQHPHAGHWAWELHRDGDRWPVGILPRAEVLAHLHRSADRVPATLLAEQTRRLVADLEAADASIGADALVRCELFVRTPEAPAAARDAVARRVREIGTAMVCRDPEKWSGYVARPLKLAPNPQSILAEDLDSDVQRNLDHEIASQDSDGSWAPSWSWEESHPEAWAVAEREWRGILTLETLGSLRAYARIEKPHPPTPPTRPRRGKP
jgi:hypothetical protein